MSFTDTEFFEQGLNFSNDDAVKLSRITKLACLAIGGGLGVSFVLMTMNNPSGAQAPGNIKLYSALAALFVGAAIGSGSCMMIRSKIIDFIESVRNLPLSSAIASMSPQDRVELRAEACKLLSLQDKIFQLERDLKSEPRVRNDLSA